MLSTSELNGIAEYLTYTRHDCRAKIFEAQQRDHDDLTPQIIQQQKKRIRDLEKLEAAVERELKQRGGGAEDAPKESPPRRSPRKAKG